jgi:hypothetical protein
MYKLWAQDASRGEGIDMAIKLLPCSFLISQVKADFLTEMNVLDMEMAMIYFDIQNLIQRLKDPPLDKHGLT